MAEVLLTVEKKGHEHTVTWAALDTPDTGSTFKRTVFQDLYVQATGTFDSGTVTLQGSNDGTNWVSLVDPQGNAIAFTAAGGEQLLETPVWIRPIISGGTSPAINIILNCVKGQ